MSLRKNFFWMISGRIGFAVSQWLVVVFIARLSSPEKLGEFTYAIAVTSPVIMFTQLNMRAYMVTDAQEKYQFSDYLASRLVSSLLAFSVVCFIGFFKASSFKIGALLITIGLYKAIESVSDILYGVLQKNEKMSRISKSVIMHGFLNFGCMVLFLMVSHSILLGAIGTALGWLILLLLYDFRGTKQFWLEKSKFELKKIIQLTKECLPLGLVLGFTSLNQNLPVYFIESSLGKEQVGLYTAIAYFVVAGRLISGSLIQATAPRLAKYYYSGEKVSFYVLLRKMAGISLFMGVFGVCAAGFFGRDILNILYGNEFADHNNIFVWIMLAGGVGYVSQFVGLILTIGRFFGYMVLSNCLSAFVILIISYFFIPTIGILGGAIALLIGNITMLLINCYVTWQKLPKKVPKIEQKILLSQVE